MTSIHWWSVVDSRNAPNMVISIQSSRPLTKKSFQVSDLRFSRSMSCPLVANVYCCGYYVCWCGQYNSHRMVSYKLRSAMFRAVRKYCTCAEDAPVEILIRVFTPLHWSKKQKLIVHHDCTNSPNLLFQLLTSLADKAIHWATCRETWLSWVQ